MRKRTRQRLIRSIPLLLVVIAIWWLLSTALSILFWLVLAAVVVLWGIPWLREFIRTRRLEAKYGPGPELNDILNQVIWSGETAEQVRDSLGEPQALESLARKTKKKEIWKYGHEGGNRYRLRVTLDDDVVVSWDLR